MKFQRKIDKIIFFNLDFNRILVYYIDILYKIRQVSNCLEFFIKEKLSYFVKDKN